MDWGKASTQVSETQNATVRKDQGELLLTSSHFADKDIEFKNEKSLGQVQSQDQTPVI